MNPSRTPSKWPAALAILCVLVAALVLSRSTHADSPNAPQSPWLARAVVVDLQDPDRLGRIKVKFPSSDREPEAWVLVAVPLGGNRSGLWALPQVGDEVVVGFEHGETRTPVVVGSLWNGEAPPPCERCSS